MRVLFTGRGTSGSWQIRGVQMAKELGAEAIAFRQQPRLANYDAIVAVKRVTPPMLEALQTSGRPWVWDIIDAYPQPECGEWDQIKAVRWVREELRRLQPTAVIWPNRRMQEDVGSEGAVIYHHHRPGIAINPIRPRLRTVGYEGSPLYLAHWHEALDRAARNVGSVFNPRVTNLADCDVVVAVRGGAADNYACRHWKSNVKLANAHGSGTPFIGQADDSYVETQAGDERWIESPADIERVLEELGDQDLRLRASELFRRRSIPLSQAASELRAVLERLK